MVENNQGERTKYRRRSDEDPSDGSLRIMDELTDANGNVLRRVQRRSSARGGDLVEEVFEHANGLNETRTTDAAQSFMEIVNRNGKTLRFTYDSLRRRISYSHVSGERSQCSFEYRGNTEQLVMAANSHPLESVFLDYDPKGRVSSVRQKGWSEVFLQFKRSRYIKS